MKASSTAELIAGQWGVAVGHRGPVAGPLGQMMGLVAGRMGQMLGPEMERTGQLGVAGCLGWLGLRTGHLVPGMRQVVGHLGNEIGLG